MFAVNAPREAIAAVRQKGFDALSPEEAAHLPRRVDTASEDHRTLIRSFFGADDPLHGGMTPEQFEGMYTAQVTWDATMGHNAVKALREHGAPGSVVPGSVMVLLVGSGHVAYGLGIQRQVAPGFEKEFGGRIAALIPIPVKDDDGDPVADFLWGVPPESDPLWPNLGLSTGTGEGDPARKVIFVTKDSAADKAGFQAGDLLLTLDGTPLTDKEVLNRLLAGKRWGDTAVFTVKRGEERRGLSRCPSAGSAAARREIAHEPAFDRNTVHLGRNHLVEPGTPPDAEAAAEIERTEGSVTFRFGARRYLYDRLGLRSGDLTPLTPGCSANGFPLSPGHVIFRPGTNPKEDIS